MAQRETDQQQQQSLRMVLVGKTGVGKSSTGNTILGKDAFYKDVSSKSVTKFCQKATNEVDGKKLEVVDTPGWCDTELSEAEIVQETVQCIDMSCPGPHVFLLVVQIGRFTEEEKKTVKKIQEVFGEGASKYMMVLFTRGDNLEGRSIDDFLKDAEDDLKKTVFKSCEGRYHVFNNKDNNPHQVSSLLQKIQDMVNCNGGSCYTNVTYQLLQNYKKREFELQQKIQAAEKELKLKMDELLEQLRETELKKHLSQAEIERMLERVLLVRMMEQMEIEEQRRRTAQEQHLQRMNEEWQKIEMTRVQMLREHQEEMRRLERQRKQAEAEREEWLRRDVKKKSWCSIS